MKAKYLNEAAPSDLMPATSDPYLGKFDDEEPTPLESQPKSQPKSQPESQPKSQQDFVDAPIDIETDIEQPPEPSLDDIEIGADQEQIDIPDIEEPLDAAPEAPTSTQTWTEVPADDPRDMLFKHIDGFMLRMRPLHSRWVAQLYKDDEILDKGQVDVPTGSDPIEYIKSVADRMLGLRNDVMGLPSQESML